MRFGKAKEIQRDIDEANRIAAQRREIEPASAGILRDLLKESLRTRGRGLFAFGGR